MGVAMPSGPNSGRPIEPGDGPESEGPEIVGTITDLKASLSPRVLDQESVTPLAVRVRDVPAANVAALIDHLDWPLDRGVLAVIDPVLRGKRAFDVNALTALASPDAELVGNYDQIFHAGTGTFQQVRALTFEAADPQHPYHFVKVTLSPAASKCGGCYDVSLRWSIESMMSGHGEERRWDALKELVPVLEIGEPPESFAFDSGIARLSMALGERAELKVAPYIRRAMSEEEARGYEREVLDAVESRADEEKTLKATKVAATSLEMLKAQFDVTSVTIHNPDQGTQEAVLEAAGVEHMKELVRHGFLNDALHAVVNGEYPDRDNLWGLNALSSDVTIVDKELFLVVSGLATAVDEDEDGGSGYEPDEDENEELDDEDGEGREARADADDDDRSEDDYGAEEEDRSVDEDFVDEADEDRDPDDESEIDEDDEEALEAELRSELAREMIAGSLEGMQQREIVVRYDEPELGVVELRVSKLNTESTAEDGDVNRRGWLILDLAGDHAKPEESWERAEKIAGVFSSQSFDAQVRAALALSLEEEITNVFNPMLVLSGPGYEMTLMRKGMKIPQIS